MSGRRTRLRPRRRATAERAGLRRNALRPRVADEDLRVDGRASLRRDRRVPLDEPLTSRIPEWPRPRTLRSRRGICSRTRRGCSPAPTIANCSATTSNGFRCCGRSSPASVTASSTATSASSPSASRCNGARPFARERRARDVRGGRRRGGLPAPGAGARGDPRDRGRRLARTAAGRRRTTKRPI